MAGFRLGYKVIGGNKKGYRSEGEDGSIWLSEMLATDREIDDALKAQIAECTAKASAMKKALQRAKAK